MADYDIGKAFSRIEDELISSMIGNLKHHKAEETKEGIQWSQWQVEQLKALEDYKKNNREKFSGQFDDINQQIENAIRNHYSDGATKQEKRILQAIKRGYKTPAKSVFKGTTATEGRFFKVNERKLNELIKATTNDMKSAETAVLRMSNDKYRKIIYDAQVYANAGGTTYEKAVDMATHDFLSAGINCIEYKNGARHTIADYADMAIRTANKRAYLRGEGTKRAEWGIHTVIVNKRGHACPLCAPFAGKVLIDDVYSGGSSKDGDYMLLSTAMSEGFLHPRCRDGYTTYFEGISTPPEEEKPTKAEEKEINEKAKLEEKKAYAENQASRMERLSKYSLDSGNKKAYGARAEQWQKSAEEIGEKLNNSVANSENSGIINIEKSIEIPENCTHLLKAETNFEDKDISKDILQAIDKTIDKRLTENSDFHFDEIKVAKFAKTDNKSVFITNLDSQGFLQKTQLYINSNFFTGAKKADIDNLCMKYYNSKWWKSKSLEDLVNHEIMHARINHYNSYEKVEQLYQFLGEDKRVKGFCHLVDEHPEEFMNEMYVAILNKEKIEQKFLDVFNEYSTNYLGVV